MQRALELARLGAGRVSPNPMVGCVIVHGNSIIGEGWHEKYGGAHAEVNAIESVKNKSLLAESTLYVTLEPCNHFGKTPPCTSLILSHKIPKVVIGSVDPNPMVSGKGIERLRKEGVEMVSGVSDEEAAELNKRFFTFQQKKRAYVILKYAQTADGFIGRDASKVSKEVYEQDKQISGAAAQMLVHKWRAEEDAILVGRNTVLHDNPKLNVRVWSGKNPMRIVVDRTGEIPETSHVLNGSQYTLIFTTAKNYGKAGHAEVVVLPEQDFARQLLHQLFERKIMSVMIEGGAQTLRTFIEENQWDEARIFTSRQIYETGIKAPVICGTRVNNMPVGEDMLTVLKNSRL